MRPAPWLVVFAAALLLAACGRLEPTIDVPATPFEGMPPPAYLHLEGDPTTAAAPFVVTFAGEDGDRGGQSFSFEEGQRIVIDRTSFAEVVSAWVDEIACEGTITTLAERETDGLLTITANGCALISLRNHPAADGVHPELSGTLSAEAPLGSTLTLTTLDDAIPAELADDADESGFISFGAVPAGRWRAVLTSGGAEMEATTITIEAGESQHLDLRR